MTTPNQEWANALISCPSFCKYESGHPHDITTDGQLLRYHTADVSDRVSIVQAERVRGDGALILKPPFVSMAAEGEELDVAECGRLSADLVKALEVLRAIAAAG
jgi:hypothetical protein